MTYPSPARPRRGWRRRCLIPAACLLRAAANGIAADDPPFENERLRYSVADSADFDGDGWLDLVVSDYTSSRITVLLNQPLQGLAYARSSYAGLNLKKIATFDYSGEGLPDLIVDVHPDSRLMRNLGDGSFTDDALLVGPDPIAPRLADLTGDGAPDLQFLDEDEDTLVLARNDGRGGFGRWEETNLSQRPVAQALADLDDDGDLDTAVVVTGPAEVHILLNAGDGTPLPSAEYDVGWGPVAIVPGDIDGDGRPDLIVASHSTGTLSVLIGEGDGSFHPFSTIEFELPGLPPPSDVVAGDIDGDGLDDLIVVREAALVDVLRNDGDGTFSDSLYGAGLGPRVLTLEDMNGDGAPDLVVAGDIGVTVLLNDGAGTFPTQTSLTIAGPFRSVVTGDLDGDGDADVAAAVPSARSDCRVFWNDGSGNLSDAGLSVWVDLPTGLAAADVDGDGAIDLTVANEWTEVIRVIRNRRGRLSDPRSRREP